MTRFLAFFVLLLLALPANGEVLTLYIMDVPPFAMNEPGRNGILGDTALEAAKRLGDQLLIESVPSPRALALVPGLKDTLIVPLARLPEREDRFSWISHIIDVERAFFSLDTPVQSFEEAKAKYRQIAVARDSAGLTILRARGFVDSQLFIADQGPSAPRMVQAGRVDAWYNPVLEAQILQQSVGGTPLRHSPPLGSTHQFLGASKDLSPKILKRYADIIEQMRVDGTLEAITRRYISPQE